MFAIAALITLYILAIFLAGFFLARKAGSRRGLDRAVSIVCLAAVVIPLVAVGVILVVFV